LRNSKIRLVKIAGSNCLPSPPISAVRIDFQFPAYE
jgi:hypothetical protein